MVDNYFKSEWITKKWHISTMMKSGNFTTTRNILWNQGGLPWHTHSSKASTSTNTWIFIRAAMPPKNNCWNFITPSTSSTWKTISARISSPAMGLVPPTKWWSSQRKREKALSWTLNSNHNSPWTKMEIALGSQGSMNSVNFLVGDLLIPLMFSSMVMLISR